MAILYGIGKTVRALLSGTGASMGRLRRQYRRRESHGAPGDGPRSDLARLHGARLVTASEGESGAYLAESVVKQLTGDDAITVRRLYENEFEFRPGAKSSSRRTTSPGSEGRMKVSGGGSGCSRSR